jgi:hypothetical protein
VRPDLAVWPPTSLTLNFEKKAATKKIKKYMFFKTALSLYRDTKAN